MTARYCNDRSCRGWCGRPAQGRLWRKATDWGVAGWYPPMVDLGPDAAVVQVLDRRQLGAGERREGRGGGVLPGLLRVARAGDDRRDAGLLDDPARARPAPGSPRPGPARRTRGPRRRRYRSRRRRTSRPRRTPRRAGCSLRWSSAANAVSWVYRPDSSPEASGTRAMMPTPAACGGGQHLIQRLAPERVQDDLHAGHAGPGDRGQGLGAGLDADPVGGDALLGRPGCPARRRPRRGNRPGSAGSAAGPGRGVSTPRLARDRSVQARKLAEGVLRGFLRDAAAHLGRHRDLAARDGRPGTAR